MARILIVEDEAAMSDLIALDLKMTGHEPFQLYDGTNIPETIRKEKIDMVLLDVMLPGKSGFELMLEIKEIPVIFLTAKNNVADKVQGLNIGAEDYITKPFETVELLARINVVLRRNKKSNKTFSIDNLTVYLDEHKAVLNGADVGLTIKEFELLEVLIINRNFALSRETILERVWGYDFMGESRCVDVHIQKLRKKLCLDNRIKTVYKFGYRLEA